MNLLILFPVTCIVCATCLLLNGSDGGIPLVLVGSVAFLIGLAAFIAISRPSNDHET